MTISNAQISRRPLAAIFRAQPAHLHCECDFQAMIMSKTLMVRKAALRRAVRFGTIGRLPEAMLSQWFVTRVNFSSHFEFVLGGHVYGHRHLSDGDPAVTSAILQLSDDQSWARTVNTLYWLHEPAAAGDTDGDWKLRILVFATKRLIPSVTLRGVDLHVDWPYVRSSAGKFTRPKIN